MRNFKEYLTVQQAADLLGVCILTLYRWDTSGKLSPKRHPINGYRLYKRSDLVKLLTKVSKTKGKK
jgi:excisionase family DNA binding protein